MNSYFHLSILNNVLLFLWSIVFILWGSYKINSCFTGTALLSLLIIFLYYLFKKRKLNAKTIDHNKKLIDTFKNKIEDKKRDKELVNSLAEMIGYRIDKLSNDAKQFKSRLSVVGSLLGIGAIITRKNSIFSFSAPIVFTGKIVYILAFTILIILIINFLDFRLKFGKERFMLYVLRDDLKFIDGRSKSTKLTDSCIKEHY